MCSINGSQAVKNTGNANVETKGFYRYKATNGIKRHLAVDTLGFASAKPSKQEKAAAEKSRFMPAIARWVIERANAWMERCKILVKNYERTLPNATTKLNLFRLRRSSKSMTDENQIYIITEVKETEETANEPIDNKYPTVFLRLFIRLQSC